MTSGLRDGPFILESLGLELGLFCLLQDAGAPRWDSFIFRVLCSELDVHLDSWGIWIPSLIPRVLGLTQKGCPIHSWSVGLITGSPPSFSGNLGQDLVPPSPLIFLFLVGVPNL